MSARIQSNLSEWNDGDAPVDHERRQSVDLHAVVHEEQKGVGPLRENHKFCPAGCGASFPNATTPAHYVEDCTAVDREANY